MMKYLHLINVLVLFGACSQKAHQANLPTEAPCFQSAVPEFSSVLYDAGIDVVGNHISGLLLVKAMPDSSSRIVFSSETGITFFDFEWTHTGEFKTHYVMTRLKKKIVINTLRKDLELLLVPESIKKSIAKKEGGTGMKYIATRNKETLSFMVSENCRSIVHVDVNVVDKKMAEAAFYPTGKNIPDSVSIRHYNFEMKITLKRIEHENAPE